MTRLDRRTFMKGTGTALAGVAGGSLAAPFISKSWAAGPHKIGILLGKTGGFALVGEHISAGIGIYVDQVGRKLVGEPLETIWLDDPDPQTGQLNAQKLIDEQKVVGLIGGASSATSLAIGAVAGRAKIPYVST